MITIYHLAASRSERIIWLAEEMGLPYAIEHLERTSTLGAPEPLKTVHPLGRVPVIRDGAVALAESGAIVDYLTRRYDAGALAVQPDAPNFADYLFWLHFAEGSFSAQLQREWYLDLLAPDGDNHPVMARVHAEGRAQLALVERHLGEVPYVAGPAFTAADIMMAVPFTNLQLFRRIDLADRPNLAAYVERITTRPAYRRAAAMSAGPVPQVPRQQKSG